MSKIMIVEDNISNLELACEVLKRAGHEVLVARNGQEAIDSGVVEIPDLVLMDLRMPIMSGQEAMLQLKANPRTQAIPIVALTASAMKDNLQKILSEGFDGCITKPIQVATFARTVADFLPSES